MKDKRQITFERAIPGEEAGDIIAAMGITNTLVGHSLAYVKVTQSANATSVDAIGSDRSTHTLRWNAGEIIHSRCNTQTRKEEKTILTRATSEVWFVDQPWNPGRGRLGSISYAMESKADAAVLKETLIARMQRTEKALAQNDTSLSTKKSDAPHTVCLNHYFGIRGNGKIGGLTEEAYQARRREADPVDRSVFQKKWQIVPKP